jgi:S1-C subfamily serine protease
MKRTLLLTLTLLLVLTGTLYAVGVNGTYKGNPIAVVQHNGVTVTPTDVPAILYENRTMVPLGMLRDMGFTVNWDNITKTANVVTEQTVTSTNTVKTLAQIKALSNRIALIYSLDANGKRTAQGSGFMLNSRGLLVTAYHVAEQDGALQKLEVILNGKTYFVGKGNYVFADQDKDIYGVYLPGESFPYLKMGELPKEKDAVFSVGYPSGVFTVFSGEVKYVYDSNKWTLDTSKPTGGTSGGAQLNQYGEVIGVVIGGDSYYGTSIQITEVESQYKQTFNE